MDDTPRVLVSTVGAWSDATGSNTMSELFKSYPKDKLACLYIRAILSDSGSCNHYFHIYEGRVLRSIFRPKIITGEEFRISDHLNHSADSVEEAARYNKYKNKKRWLFLFAREFVWLLGKWKTKELDSFIDGFNPEVLVCPIESYIHFNRINEYIIKRKRPRVIGFLWDDNFTYKQQPYSVGYRLHRWWLRKSVKRLVHKCNHIVAISPKMKAEADEYFGIESTLLTKPIFNQPPFIHCLPTMPIRILYTGNLFVGRDETMALIADTIKSINQNGQKAILDIYTSTYISPSLKERINVPNCCYVHDPIPQSDVLVLQKKADVLLFVESLHTTKNNYARLSFSTKITDYFCAGKCIWAVGSRELSAIDYLSRQDAALCSTSEDSIQSCLESMVNNPSLVSDYAYRAWRCGKDNHNAESILTKLKEIILD